MSLFERIQSKILIEQTTGSTGEEKKQQRRKGADFSDTSSETAKKKKTPNQSKYERLRDQRTKYNVFKNKEGVYKPSIASAKAKMGERLTNITKPPDPKATQKNALNASPGRVRKLNKAQLRAARFEPGAGKERTIKLAGGGTEVKKFDKDYRTRILDRITKNQEGKIDTSKKGRINRMRAGISAKSPTIATKIIGKDGKPQRIPMPGGPNEVDFATGGKGVNQKGIRTDQAVINRMGRDASKEEIAKAKKQQAAYDDQVKANQKQLKQKGGAKYYTGKDTPLNRKVFNRSDFNLQKVYDDLSSETGGRDRRKRAKNQPTKQQVQSTIDKRYPTKQGKDTRPPRFVKGKDGVVRQYGGGKIPDKSSGAYGSANDRVAVSADKKTRIKHPEYEKMKKDARKIKKKYTKINSGSGTGGGFSGSGGQKSFSIPKTKPASRFSRVLKALKKNPKTALAAAAIGTGIYLYNQGKKKPKKIIPPVAGGGRNISARTSDINFTLGGKSGYGGSAGRTSKGAD